MLELALVSSFATAVVPELKTNIATTGCAATRRLAAVVALSRYTLVLAHALVTVLAAPAQEVATNLLTAIVTTSVIRPMAEPAAVAMNAGSTIAEFETLPALAAFGLGDHIAFRVLILALVAETAATSVAEGPADLVLFRHLK